MIASKITKRYAKALLDLAIEQGKLENTYQDLVLLDKVCIENSDFILMLKSPIINTDKKLSVINSIFSISPIRVGSNKSLRLVLACST